jgi:hypothetical protein
VCVCVGVGVCVFVFACVYQRKSLLSYCHWRLFHSLHLLSNCTEGFYSLRCFFDELQIASTTNAAWFPARQNLNCSTHSACCSLHNCIPVHSSCSQRMQRSPMQVGKLGNTQNKCFKHALATCNALKPGSDRKGKHTFTMPLLLHSPAGCPQSRVP